LFFEANKIEIQQSQIKSFHVNLEMYFVVGYFSASSGHCTKTSSANRSKILADSDNVLTLQMLST
jgi:hypothetical protein